MARLSPVDPAQALGKAKDLLAGVERKLGQVPNMMRAMASAPAVLEGYLGLANALGSGMLDPQLREQIALAVAQENECDYCLAAHTALARRVKLSDSEIADSRRHSAADPRTAAALEFAVALVRGRGHVGDATFASVLQSGFGEGEIAEIIAHVALSVLTNYFNKAAEVAIDFPRAPRAA